MSTVNMVRYFFYKGCLPDTQQRLQELVAVAYQTARDRKLYPKVVLIRYYLFHATTNIMGRPQKDPLGPHVTLCYKDENQMTKGTHVACHGYVEGPNRMIFVRSTHAGEKVDTWVKSSGDIVYEAPEIGYGHFPEPAETDCTGVNT
ncbi:hypothetical protein ASPFODRAFT_134323 [Aspergillus luchuensis CBS 106.47]|uniref:Uncharacterized protein n=1 Tax=Aspergillus luchuensis (strain CBS 106.47) TaxID=1137211 RepID=A0A1M3TIC5_ASPLC|nr:hypothetical protein ASPFODRAFT_134323 [Aspergillus luchuensis CBS 106.47]